MRLCASVLAWNKKYDKEMFLYLKDNGLDGLEIAPTRIVNYPAYDRIGEAAVFAKEVKVRFGLNLPSMQSIWYGRTENLFGTDKEREFLLNYTRSAIDFAVACGCRNLVFGCPKNRILTSEALPATADLFFREIGTYAFRRGAVVSLEAIPAIYGTNFLNTTAQAADYLEKISSPGLGLNLDFGTMLQNGESPDSIEPYLGCVQHVHISEPFLAPVKPRGEHRRLRELLEKSGYNGYVSMEMKDTGSTEEIRRAIHYLKDVFGS